MSLCHTIKDRVLTQEATQVLDPMLACKQPNIGSGATAIGSTARAPDERQNSDAKYATTAKAHQLEHIDSVSPIRVHQLHSCLDRPRLRYNPEAASINAKVRLSRAWYS